MIKKRYQLSFLFSFNGMLYELMLSQNLGAALGGTLLRYFITIGLFTLCLGFSALFFDYMPEKAKTVANLFKLHTYFLFVLVLLPLFFFGLEHLLKIDMLSYSVFQFLYHVPLVAIALITGFEIPFLLHEQEDDFKSRILAFDYGGMFLACLAFPLFFLESLGLVGTYFVVLLIQIFTLRQIKALE